VFGAGEAGAGEAVKSAIGVSVAAVISAEIEEVRANDPSDPVINVEALLSMMANGCDGAVRWKV
jgi:hypothetical protein